VDGASSPVDLAAAAGGGLLASWSRTSAAASCGGRGAGDTHSITHLPGAPRRDLPALPPTLPISPTAATGTNSGLLQQSRQREDVFEPR